MFALFVQKKGQSHLKGVGGLYICQKVSKKKAISGAEANIRRLARSHLSLFVTPTADNVVQFKAVEMVDGGRYGGRKGNGDGGRNSTL